MPGVARGNGVDTVAVPHGAVSGPGVCMTPTISTTDECSSSVFVGGVGIVRLGDNMAVHIGPDCVPHTVPCSSSSSSVIIEGKFAARIGDVYGGDHVITSGLASVIIGD